MHQGFFDHDKLDVYRAARQFKRQLRELLLHIPRGNADLVDQLRRAARSITNNLAEGSGKWTTRDKVHYYHIARGSATECAANLDECVDFGLLAEEQVAPLQVTLSRVVAMLVKMIQALERRGVDMGAPQAGPDKNEAVVPREQAAPGSGSESDRRVRVRVRAGAHFAAIDHLSYHAAFRRRSARPPRSVLRDVSSPDMQGAGKVRLWVAETQAGTDPPGPGVV